MTREKLRSLLYAALAVWGVVSVALRWMVMPRARFAAWRDRMEAQ